MEEGQGRAVAQAPFDRPKELEGGDLSAEGEGTSKRRARGRGRNALKIVGDSVFVMWQPN